jgi:hypothetical protein
VQPSDARLPAVIAKLRPFHTAEDQSVASAQTAHEFAVHSAVWNAIRAVGREQFAVPMPLLAHPEHGLLYMEYVRGEPMAHSLRRQLFRVGSGKSLRALVRSCGEWLYTYSCSVPPIPWPEPASAVADVLRADRSRHHVYCLIGLSGQRLSDAMLAQVTRRLSAYGVDRDFRRRIEAGFHAALHDIAAGGGALGNVHGKFSIADVLVQPGCVSAIDLEQAGCGSPYLDTAYFLFQISMVTRWTFGLFGTRKRSDGLRQAFINARSPARELDEYVLDAFVAYYMVNSFRPGDGVAGLTARRHVRRSMEAWLRRMGN